ncbi:MAG: hypothetical protein AB7O98_03150 [Hyphomonadaceae bacterium]
MWARVFVAACLLAAPLFFVAQADAQNQVYLNCSSIENAFTQAQRSRSNDAAFAQLQTAAQRMRCTRVRDQIAEHRRGLSGAVVEDHREGATGNVRRTSDGTTGRTTPPREEPPPAEPESAPVCTPPTDDELPLLTSTVDELGQLTTDDPQTTDCYFRYDQFRIALGAGEGVRVSMRSTQVSPVLAVGTGRLPDTFSSEAGGIAGADGVARMNFIAPQDGEYTVIAATSDTDRIGAYQLVIASWAPPQPPAPLAVGFDQTLERSLGENSALLEGSLQPYEYFSFNGRAGQSLRIAMESEAFDPFVSIGRITQSDGVAAFEEIAFDDDGGEGLNSELLYTVETDGVYIVRARSYSASSAGAYRLTVFLRPPPTRIAISAGAGWIARGVELTRDSATDDNGAYYQDFEIPVRSGRRYTAAVYSNMFSPSLLTGRVVDGLAVIDRPVVAEGEEPPAPTQTATFEASARGAAVIRVTGAQTGTFDLVITEVE